MIVSKNFRPIPYNVSLHSKYFKVVQGHVLLVHRQSYDLLAIAGFLVQYKVAY